MTLPRRRALTNRRSSKSEADGKRLTPRPRPPAQGRERRPTARAEHREGQAFVMRPRTKISRITQAQDSMATALDQETVHTETTAEPSATPVEAPASSVGGTRVSRTSV